MRIAGAARLMRATYARYLAASGLALAVDCALFLLLLAGHCPPAAASGCGYAGGVLAHWLLSSRAVFAAHLARPGGARDRQTGLFVASAALGLAVTMAVVGAGAALGIDPRSAKLAAIAISFQLVWLVRRHWVFAA